MDVIRIVLGGVLLAFGRRLFWLFVGIIGFIVGLDLANRLFGELSEVLVLVVALVVGLIGALLAVTLQRIAIAVVGFLVGGYLFVNLLELFRVDLGGLSWIPFLLGGIIGAILLSALFDWALIVLSSLTGATLVVQGLQLTQPLAAAVLVGLLILGIIFQAGLNRRRRSA